MSDHDNDDDIYDGVTVRRGDSERLAFELACIDRIPADLSLKLGLANKLDFTETIAATGSHGPAPAVVFKCSLLEAAVVCDLVRSYDRRMRNPISGVFVSRNGGVWVRIQNWMQLTLKEPDPDSGKERVVLNPRAFDVPVKVATIALPRTRRVEL